MMGGVTLAEVRARLAAAMAGPEGGRASPTGRSEVAEALERFLAGSTAGPGKPVPTGGAGHGERRKSGRVKPRA